MAISVTEGAETKEKEPGNVKKRATPALIEVTGSILGAKIFESLTEAREKLDPLRLDKNRATEEAEKGEREGGQRVFWRLAATEYQWIVAWADKEGKIIKISASLRPEKKKAFREIGNLARAKVHTDSTAMWIVERPDGSSFRLVAKGPGEQATSIYMYSLQQTQEID